MQERNLELLLEDLGLKKIKQYNNEICCKCPWHNDDTPSLYINLKKNKHICFAGCTKGSINSLIRKLGGTDWHIQRTSIIIQDVLDIELEKELSGYRERFVPNYEFFSLLKPALGDSYLIGRGLDNTTISSFDIRSRYNSIYIPIYSNDFFYPHKECSGTIVNNLSFCGYIERRKDEKIYINSPGFLSNRHFFPNDLNTNHFDGIILVEGPFDVLRLRQNGYTNSFSLLGNSLSKEKEKMIISITRRVVLCLDNDIKGKQATKLIKHNLEQLNIEVEKVELPNNIKDIAELNNSDIKGIMKKYE